MELLIPIEKVVPNPYHPDLGHYHQNPFDTHLLLPGLRLALILVDAFVDDAFPSLILHTYHQQAAHKHLGPIDIATLPFMRLHFVEESDALFGMLHFDPFQDHYLYRCVGAH